MGDTRYPGRAGREGLDLRKMAGHRAAGRRDSPTCRRDLADHTHWGAMGGASRAVSAIPDLQSPLPALRLEWDLRGAPGGMISPCLIEVPSRAIWAAHCCHSRSC